MIMAGTRENFYDQLKQPLSEDSGIIQILLPFEISYYLKVQKTPRQISLSGFQKQGYKDSNLEMTESESVMRNPIYREKSTAPVIYTATIKNPLLSHIIRNLLYYIFGICYLLSGLFFICHIKIIII